MRRSTAPPSFPCFLSAGGLSRGSGDLCIMDDYHADTRSLVDPVEIDVGGLRDKETEESLSTSYTDEGYCSPVYRISQEHKAVLLRQMTENGSKHERIYKIVLTGGPCGGKTTGQERLATFFENMGWKVYTVPEAATVLLSGGVKFAELSHEQAYEFQKDLLATLMRIEDVFFRQAALETERKVLIICDRGAMDPSAYIDTNSWQRMLKELGLEQFNLRENRYNQVVHMVTAADGAEKYYTLANNKSRKEGLEQAMDLDRITRNAWIGHPYVDVIDNTDCAKFDDKILKLIQVVCDRAGVEVSDRLAQNSKKRKWLVVECDDAQFPKFEEFKVTHDYLITDKNTVQVRLRTRTQNNRTTYTLTTRTAEGNETVETRMQLTLKEYQSYYRMKDKSRATLHKTRKCFSFGLQYYHLDIYVDPLPPACRGRHMMILETYTTHPADSPEPQLPDFLKIEKEITGDSRFSMYALSKIAGRRSSHHHSEFCGSAESENFSDD